MDYSSLTAERLFQICAETNDSAPWEEFIRRYNLLIYKVASRLLRSMPVQPVNTPEEIVQAFYLKLCQGKILQKFKQLPNTPAEAYLTTVVTHFVLDRFKSVNSLRHGAGMIAVEVDSDVLPLCSEHTGSAAATERQFLLSEVDECVRDVITGQTRERDLMVFNLYYRYGFTASEIAAIPGIELKTKGVESLVLRLTHLVRKRMVGNSQGNTPQESFK